MSRVRIAVTGVGLVTPLGITRDVSWTRLLAGERASRWLTAADVGWSEQDQPFGKKRHCGAPVEWTTTGESRLTAFTLHAANEAVRQAGLNSDQLRDSGCVIGTSKPDLLVLDHQPAESSPTLTAWLLPSAPVTAVSAALGCQAAAICPVAACATGLVSVIQGASLIRSGVCPIVLVGGADTSMHPALLASYSRLGVLAAPGDDPASACRPFDVSRNGFVVGEGAGVLVLEDWNHAQQRGAVPLAEWIDGRFGSDPTGLTAADASGAELARLIERTLSGAGILPDDVDAVSVHGTGTRINDLAEAGALRRLFGSRRDQVECFGLKGAIGHLMGAAGAVESAACILALRDQLIPPTANHFAPDPECGLMLHATARRPPRLDHLMKLSLGFGGHLAVGLFRRAAGVHE